MLFLSKLVPMFVYPLGLGVGLGVLAFAVLRWRTVARVILALSIAVLWVPSMPVFANWLSTVWESAYPPLAADQLPETDVIVLLGGLIAQPLPPRVEPDLKDAGDRLFKAARLFHAGRAPRILVSGGNTPWQSAAAPEAVYIADMLVELGVPRAAIQIETVSRNTRENAVNTAAIVRENGWRTALLVTSADHMPRAVACFEKVGVAVTAASADVHARTPFYSTVLDVLPDADALVQTTSVVKEMIGLIYYRVRGWA